MDTRQFNTPDAASDPWGKDRDVANHTARDERATEARRVTHEHIAISTGQAVLRMPEFTTLQAPQAQVKQEAPLKRDREALRRPVKHGLFGKRA